MPKKGLKWAVIALCAAVAILAFYNIHVNKTFLVTEYTVESEKLEKDFTGVLIADLHEKEYGTDNEHLLDQLKTISPDIIFIAGDLVNGSSRDFSNTTKFLKNLSDIAPVYYGYGNHEFFLDLNGIFSPIKEYQDMENVHVIAYGVETAVINDNRIKIGALSVEPVQWEKYGEKYFELFERGDDFFVLLSHYPWLIPDCYPETTTDVVLSGHAHGGQIHLWNDVGLLGPGKGLFAPYTSGIHDIWGTTEIVSRGLGDHTALPRINNQPELIVLRFKKNG